LIHDIYCSLIVNYLNDVRKKH